MEHSNVLEGETFKPEKKRNSSLRPKKNGTQACFTYILGEGRPLLPLHLVGMIFFVLQIWQGHGGDGEKGWGASLEP